MKTRAVFLLAATALATFIPVSFAAISSAAEFTPFTLNLKPGSSSATVRTVLGVPDATLGPDLWIYLSLGAQNPNRDNPEFDTLVVAFTNDRVTAVKITDGRVVRQLLAQAARDGKTGVVAGAPAKR
jgi:hypothetical protein